MGLTQILAPAEEPISLAEAKDYHRHDGADNDAVLMGLIVAAREAAEHETGRALVTQRWRLSLDAWPQDGIIRLPRPPLASVEAVSYLDSAGTRQTLSAAAYQVISDELIGELRPAYNTAWPACRETPGSIRIDYTAGYGGAAAVPQAIRAWMQLTIGAGDTQRAAIVTGTNVSDLPRPLWDALLDAYRIHKL